MYQVIWKAEIWLETRRKSAHANTAQMALSMSSSRYCSTFAPLSSLFLCCRCFLGFFDSFFLFFDIFSSLRSTKEVTTENMSLNKWKAWPVENSEDMIKIDKMLVTTKRESCDHFLTNLKFLNPDKAGDGRIQKNFLIDFDIWNIEIGVRMRKLDQF